MFEWICFIIGILCLVITITFAIKSRHDLKKSIGIALFGFLITSVLFVFPTVSSKWRDNAFLDVIYKLLYSLLYSLKAIVGRQDLSQIDLFALTGIVKHFYIFIAYAIYFISPILTTAWLLSFFGDFGEKIRYAFHFSENAYIFNELNENSLSILQGVKKEDKQAVMVNLSKTAGLSKRFRVWCCLRKSFILNALNRFDLKRRNYVKPN